VDREDRAAEDRSAELEPVAPLEVSLNRWTRTAPVDGEQNVERKVRALLNKLTMAKFDTISDQIIEWTNKSEAETDARTLIHVTRLIFEATGEAAWLEMYARLCRKMMETISPNVQDDGIRNAEGKPITGGQLFRKYLLNRCQEHFERGWSAKDAAAKISEGIKKVEEASSEVELYSDEYYAAQKAKRQGLGLIQFIGELYKLRMLTERIMHECIKKLLAGVDNPQEEEIESLCRLLTAIGRLLDNPKGRAHMDIYFTRMKGLEESSNVAPRIQFILQVSFAPYARPMTSSCFFVC
jgi:translation initiation factor 4G